MNPLYIALLMIPLGVALIAAAFKTRGKTPELASEATVAVPVQPVPSATYTARKPATDDVPEPRKQVPSSPIVKSPIPLLTDDEYTALVKVNDYASKLAASRSYDHATSEDVQTLRDRIVDKRFGSVFLLAKAVDLINDVTVTSALGNIDSARFHSDYSLRTPEEVAAVAMNNRSAMVKR